MISRVTKGEAPSLVDADKANELIDAINAIMKSKGAGGIEVKADQSGQLTIFPSGADDIQTTYHPFQVISVGEDNVAINAGTVNNELVVPVGGISHSPSSSLSYLYIDIDAGENGINSAEYKIKQSPPDGMEFRLNKPPPRLEILIAVLKDRGWEQVVHTNLNANIVRAYENPKDSVVVGEYDNDIYWRWYITKG
jgi:hypothetical protein